MNQFLIHITNVNTSLKSRPIGSFSNHDERDDDDVKYARRDWDENFAFGGKMKLKVAQNSFQHLDFDGLL